MSEFTSEQVDSERLVQSPNWSGANQAAGEPLGSGWLSQVRAIQLDALSSQTIFLREVWSCLAAGVWRVAAHFCTDDRFYFVLATHAEQASCSRDVDVREMEMLRRTLLGERQKVVAFDLARSQSTVNGRLGACLGAMGFDRRASRTPALLVAAAAAAENMTLLQHARFTFIDEQGRNPAHRIVSAPRLDGCLHTLVSAIELQVAKLFVDGQSYKTIAARRGTSPRTIANQLSSVFRKAGISGRPELLVYLATHFQPKAML